MGDLPQAEVAIPRGLARDDARAQQHRADRVHPHRRRVQDQHPLNASVRHDQLPDRHEEAVDEEQDVLVHLWVTRLRGELGLRVGARGERRQQASGEVRGSERHRAYHTNGQDSVVFREAKRRGGWHEPAQRSTLLVQCCREPARDSVLVQQDQERYRHAQRCNVQVFAQRFDRQDVPEERRAPRRRGRLAHTHFGRRRAGRRESRSAPERSHLATGTLGPLAGFFSRCTVSSA